MKRVDILGIFLGISWFSPSDRQSADISFGGKKAASVVGRVGILSIDCWFGSSTGILPLVPRSQHCLAYLC
jgi:hypothetical protein